MKTIFRIAIVLLAAVIVAGGFYLLANNTNIASGRDLDDRQPPAMTSEDGQTFQPRERPEGGDEHGASLSHGLAGVAGTLVKLTIITLVVLLAQKGFSLLGKRKLTTVQR